MPQLGNITVKAANGTTDVVYSGVSASAGDRSPAIWRGPTGSAPAYKPSLEAVAAPNQRQTSRSFDVVFKWPYVVTGTDGIARQAHLPKMRLVIDLPQAVPQTELDEFVSQGCRLIGHADFIAMVKSGYSST